MTATILTFRMKPEAPSAQGRIAALEAEVARLKAELVKAEHQARFERGISFRLGQRLDRLKGIETCMRWWGLVP